MISPRTLQDSFSCFGHGEKRKATAKGPAWGEQIESSAALQEQQCQRLLQISEQLKQSNLAMQEVKADGNCLFRAIADQLDGNQHNHDMYRQNIVEYIKQCEDDFAPFVEDDVDFETYVKNMKDDAEWGGQIELTACSRLYSVNIVIYHLDAPTYVIKNEVEKGSDTIKLSYHDGEHYNSVRNVCDIDSGEPVCKYKIINPLREKENGDTLRDDDVSGGEWQLSAAQIRKQKRMERKARKKKKEREKINRRRRQYGTAKRDDRHENANDNIDATVDALSESVGAIVL